jgi:hypothetical protein
MAYTVADNIFHAAYNIGYSQPRSNKHAYYDTSYNYLVGQSRSCVVKLMQGVVAKERHTLNYYTIVSAPHR